MLSFLKGAKKDPTPAPAEDAAPKKSWTQRLRDGLSATREKLGGQLRQLFTSTTQVDEAFYEELETILLSCDVGVAATRHLIDTTRARVRKSGASTPAAVRDELKNVLIDLVAPLERPLEIGGQRPFVILMCGVNGAGKTTSIGKLAHLFQAQGLSVLLAAGDTFRAAAREQLAEWGERNNVTVVAQVSGDPGAVVFDAVQSATAKGIGVVLADTAGRLPTQLHLMEELKKVRRVTNKAMAGAPHETLLVLDANTGQNAVAQVKAFDDAIGLSGLILTKLDGTAKGGVIAAIARERPVPVRFIGVGESLEDLRPFEARAFVDAMLD
ncbi:MAG: signal recognition particle-docking protein FtsY [Burkholderiales bacterium]